MSLLLAAAVCLAGWLVAAAPSDAASVPDSRCARYDHGIRTGICFQDSRGIIYWLGTYRGYDGVELYCIDYLYATDWVVAHERRFFTGGVTSLGSQVSKATAAALTHVVTRHPASTADDITAAAIGLIIREVMGDVRNSGGRPIPGGLTASSSVRDVGFVSDAVVRRARALWEDARAHRGPWHLTTTIDPGADGRVTVGERVRLSLRGTSGSGKPQNMRVALSYRGFRGPSTVTLGPDGVAAVTLVAPGAPGTGSLVARVTDAPAPHPVVVRPNDWRTNPRPGHSFSVSQRGLLGRQAVVTATASVSTVIVKAQPRLLTRASATRVEPGASVRDSVRVLGTRGAAGSFTWALRGPVPVRADGSCPGSGDRAWAAARTLASGRMLTRGDGTYLTPAYVVKPADVGCLTYVESMPATSTTLAASTPPGVPAETVLVVRPKVQPELVTRASAQRVEPGAEVHDQVDVTGTGGESGSFDWSLLGPVRAHADGTCPGSDAPAWSSAGVLASGTVTTNGDGTYATPTYVVRPADVGCLTYVESMPATPTTLPARTRPGVPAETVLVVAPRIVAPRKAQPCVSTVASRQSGLVGSRLRDTVRVGCLRAGDRVVVAWTLHGPIAPVIGAGALGCDLLGESAWRRVRVAARGSFVANGPGTFRTTPVVVRKPGCYTYSESVAATDSTRAARTRPGLALETAMFTRPALPKVPVVPTGPDRIGDRGGRGGPGAGVLRIGSLGVTVPVEAVGLRDGVMAVPDSPSRAGWLRASARPGDVIGSSVIAGHVSDGRDRPGPFARLERVRKGARIVWTDVNGKRRRFEVTSVASYPRNDGLPASVFRTDGRHTLRLVTCTHRVTLLGGGFHYTDNLVVTAREVPRVRH